MRGTVVTFFQYITHRMFQLLAASESTDDVGEGSTNLYFTNDRVRAISLDSEDATNLIDSAYIQARQSAGGGGGSGTVDSADIIAIVDSAYVQARQKSAQNFDFGTISSPSAFSLDMGSI